MNKAKIFILAWVFILACLAVGFYFYTVHYGKPLIPKLEIFSSEQAKSLEKKDGLLDGWFGKIDSEKVKDLYPAKEADLHVDLGEKEKSYIISVDKLSSSSLVILENELSSSGVIYSVSKNQDGYSVDITFKDKPSMLSKLETIKQLKFDSKTR